MSSWNAKMSKLSQVISCFDMNSGLILAASPSSFSLISPAGMGTMSMEIVLPGMSCLYGLPASGGGALGAAGVAATTGDGCVAGASAACATVASTNVRTAKAVTARMLAVRLKLNLLVDRPAGWQPGGKTRGLTCSPMKIRRNRLLVVPFLLAVACGGCRHDGPASKPENHPTTTPATQPAAG